MLRRQREVRLRTRAEGGERAAATLPGASRRPAYSFSAPHGAMSVARLRATVLYGFDGEQRCEGAALTGACRVRVFNQGC